MKRIYLLLITALVTISAFAVSHANTWTIYSYFRDYQSPEEDSGYFTTLTAGKDTLIEGKTYFQVYDFLFRYNEDSTRVYCRVTEDDVQNNRHYAHDILNYTQQFIMDNEILCYAYDVQANDTLNILRYGSDSWATICVVDSVKIIDGRRYVYNHYADYDLYSEYDNEMFIERWEDDCWIEGIGTLDGFFRSHPGRVASMYKISGSYLFCASHDDELLYRASTEKAQAIYDAYGVISPCHEDVIKLGVEAICCEAIPQDAVCNVYTPAGTMILSGIKLQNIDSQLTSGMYIISASSGQKNYVKKVVK